jgi:hypothetical protein
MKWGKQVSVTKQCHGGQDGIQKLVERWQNCIEVRDYVQK